MISNYFFSQTSSGIIVCSVIFATLVIYLLLSILIAGIYKKWTKDIEIARKNGVEVFKGNMLNRIFEDYKGTASLGNSNINTEVIIEKHMPLYMNKTQFILNYLVATATILGLFGTFIGLTGAIMDLKGVLTQIDKIETFIEGIKPPMASMATAFITSIVGILVSIIMNFASIIPFISYKNYRDEFYDELVDYLDNEIYVKYNPSTNKALIMFTEKVEKSMQYMTDRVTETFEEGIKQFSSKINGISVDLTESAKTLASVINKLEDSIVKFNTPVISFKQSVDNFKLYYEGLDTKIRDVQLIADSLKISFESVITSLNSNSDNINNVGTELMKSTTMLAEEHSKFSNILDGLDKFTHDNDEQLKKSVKTMEETYKTLSTILQELKVQTSTMGSKISAEISNTLGRELNNLSEDLNGAVDNNYKVVEVVNQSFEEKLNIFGKTLNSYERYLGELSELGGALAKKSEVAAVKEEHS